MEVIDLFEHKHQRKQQHRESLQHVLLNIISRRTELYAEYARLESDLHNVLSQLQQMDSQLKEDSNEH